LDRLCGGAVADMPRNFLDDAGSAISSAVGWCQSLVGSRSRADNSGRSRRQQHDRQQQQQFPPPPRQQAHGPVKLSTDRVRQNVWRLPIEEFMTTGDLQAWTVKELKEELTLAARRAPRALTNQQPALAPLDKLELVAAVELARGGESARCCAICVDDFGSGDMLRVLQCAHRFHIECVDRWLLDADHGCGCPICKSPLT